MSESKKLVLVVDDDEDIRDILTLQIEELEYEWISAVNGVEGLEMIKSNPEIDIVISDVTMPKMNGIEFLRATRESGFEKPFIVLTGNATKNMALEALRLGAFDFLEKPYDPSHMMSLFTSAMNQSKEMQDKLDSPSSAVDPHATLHDDSKFLDNLHQRGSSDSWETGNTREEFIENYSHQLSFCKASVKNLVKKSEATLELGYLFRVTRALTSASKYWGFYDICSLSYEMSELLLYLRANPSLLNKDFIQSISEGINSASGAFKALSTDRSVMLSCNDLKLRFKDHNQKINGHRSQLKKAS